METDRASTHTGSARTGQLQPTDDNPRRRELVQRLDKGDFDAAFEVSVAPDALKAGFRLAAHVAHADHDPADRFEAFTASLWRQIANMFDVHRPPDG